MKKLFSFFIIGSLLVVANCSKDDNDKNDSSPTGPTTEDAPMFKTHRVELPESMVNSTDPHVLPVVGYTNMANLFSGTLNSYFLPPGFDHANGNRPWQHVWQDGELTVEVLIKKLTDRYTWEATFNGQQDGEVYQNFIAFRAEQAFDERSGAFYMYDPESDDVAGQYTWYLDDDNSLHFEVSAEQYVAGTKFVGVVNDDRSGTLELFSTLADNEILVKKYQWDSAGAGEWWEYDTEGNLIDSGSWN